MSIPACSNNDDVGRKLKDKWLPKPGSLSIGHKSLTGYNSNKNVMTAVQTPDGMQLKSALVGGVYSGLNKTQQVAILSRLTAPVPLPMTLQVAGASACPWTVTEGSLTERLMKDCPAILEVTAATRRNTVPGVHMLPGTLH